jgi:hypothetical protein
MMQRVRFGLILAISVASGVLNGCANVTSSSSRTETGGSPAARPAHIDPRADEALRRMSAALSNAKSFGLKGAATMDELLPSGQLAEFSRETRVVVRRPDRLFAEIHRGEGAWLFWYAGNDLTVLDKRANTCASVQVPGRIDDMLDDLAEKHGLTMPLADLLFADPYKVLTADALTGQLVGTHEVNGVECTHLLFTQANVDWQIWIETGKMPVPRKVVIDYKTLPGRPQFAAMLSDWNLSAAADDDQFKPALPADARKIDLAQMLKDKEEKK